MNKKANQPNVRTELDVHEYLDYYDHNFYCANCDKRNRRYIRRGVLIKIVSVQCENCGCKIQ